ncbi:glycosyltransferase family 2 protein [Acetivibrio cellulolyticus]|uniref:glycosyltransferase family 2 protein n=1 Tax=Acetivibrio cellulolyticus TaxID=35830 RepID=UPI0001E2CBE4|nr:glycosyltransferase family 2 protein [Acetivibrio cellulolyticus]
MKNLLTISIVSYNNFDDVKNAVETIEKYTDPKINKKIYIIDNANEQEDYRRFVMQYSDVEYVHTGENLGFGKGHNYMIYEIDSKYHAIVNPDIIVKEDVFSRLISFMSDETIGMVVPKIVNHNGEILWVYRREITIVDMFIRMFCRNVFKKRFAYHTMQDMDYTKSFQVPFAQGSFLLVRTDLFKQLNGFDDKYFMYVEDADLCRRVNEVSSLKYCPDVSVLHKWEKGSHKSKILFKYHLQSAFIYFKKWGIRWL